MSQRYNDNTKRSKSKEIQQRILDPGESASTENKILNPSSHCDQIIPLFGGHFKFLAVSWYMPKNPVATTVGRQRKFCNLDRLKQPFQQFFTIFYSKI